MMDISHLLSLKGEASTWFNTFYHVDNFGTGIMLVGLSFRPLVR